MPNRVSGRPTIAVDAKTRRCVQRASSRPPPRAREETAEMVGIGRAERAVNVALRFARKAAVLLPCPFVSPSWSLNCAIVHNSDPKLKEGMHSLFGSKPSSFL